MHFLQVRVALSLCMKITMTVVLKDRTVTSYSQSHQKIKPSTKNLCLKRQSPKTLEWNARPSAYGACGHLFLNTVLTSLPTWDKNQRARCGRSHGNDCIWQKGGKRETWGSRDSKMHEHSAHTRNPWHPFPKSCRELADATWHLSVWKQDSERNPTPLSGFSQWSFLHCHGCPDWESLGKVNGEFFDSVDILSSTVKSQPSLLFQLRLLGKEAFWAATKLPYEQEYS